MAEGEKMTVGGLFEGIGGFPLAATWAGMTPVWSNEIDPFCCKVLRKNFKHEIIEADIRTIGKHNLKPVDVITGGFPCQPFSTAGKRKGKNDDRFLWPEMLRVIREVCPLWVVGENVAGIIKMALDQVLSEMENEGYWNCIDKRGKKRIVPFLIPACALNAPHRRDRVWIVAHSGGSKKDGRQNRQMSSSLSGAGDGLREDWIVANPRHAIEQGRFIVKEGQQHDGGREVRSEPSSSGICGAAPHSVGKGLSVGIQSPEQCNEKKGFAFQGSKPSRTYPKNQWGEFPTVSPIRGGNDGLSSGMVRSAIKAYGNAIVPQIAFEIFKAIETIELK